MLEKNIIVGNVRNAKFSKDGCTLPDIQDLNKNVLPESENDTRVVIALSNDLKIGSQKGVPNIKKARKNCRPIPERTVLKLIAFLLSDNKNAIPKRVNIPINAVSLSIIYLLLIMLIL